MGPGSLILLHQQFRHDHRLVYHGRMVEFTGASHRMENALMLGKQSEEDAR